jgi:hypothetical protein
MAIDPEEKARRARSAGCLGALIGIPVLLCLAALFGLTACGRPNVVCRQSSFWREVTLPTLAITALASLCCYWAARWWHRR